MKKSTWRPALALAAATTVAAPAAAENTDGTTYDIRAEWLDPAVVDHPKAHERIISELANYYPVKRGNLDELGLNSAAASAFAEARNKGELHLKLYETDREWWLRKQPQLEQIMENYRAREVNRSLTVLGTMGVAGGVGAGLIAWKSRRRQKQEAKQAKAAPAPAPGPGGRR